MVLTLPGDGIELRHLAKFAKDLCTHFGHFPSRILLVGGLNDIYNRMPELKNLSGPASQEDGRIATVLVHLLKSMCIVHQWHELDWISEYAIVMPPAVGRRHTTLQMNVHVAAWIAKAMGITVIYTGNDVEQCSERVGGAAEMCYIEAWNFLQQISCSLPAIGVHPLC